MIVDDEQGIRDLLSFELGSKGYEVVTAQEGSEALERFKKEKFDLVITDLKMPGMDGIALLEALKKIDPQIKVVLITGFGTIETVVAAIKKGAYDFIRKPFELKEIFSLVEKVLSKKEGGFAC